MPVLIPTNAATTTNAIHPKIAFLRLRALQRPIRAAKLGEVLLVDDMPAGSLRGAVSGIEPVGVLGCGFPHRGGSSRLRETSRVPAYRGASGTFVGAAARSRSGPRVRVRVK